jgi:CYTH domain-containing protein
MTVGEIPEYARSKSDKPIWLRMRTYQSASASDNKSSKLTLKTRWSKLSRWEFEYDIPTADAEELMSLRQGNIVEKVRYIVPAGELIWEIDVFSGENLGLVIAEIELPSQNHHIELPPWIGAEITGQDRYHISAAFLPFVVAPQRGNSRRIRRTPAPAG